MSVQKTIQADRTAPEDARQPGETDIERTPLKLRNPDLAETYASPRGRTIRPGEAGPDDSANAASNGHWMHDDVGPTDYIGPDADALPGTELTARQIVELIEERLGYMAGLDASRIHVSVTGGTVTLSGQVDSADARRRAGSCAVAAAEGAPVENRLTVQT
jgi:hypothetical protein